MKHEQGDKPYVAGAYTGAKMYAYRCEDGESDKDSLKGKGVPTAALKRQHKTVEAYKRAILHNDAEPARFNSTQSSNHVVQHRIMTKSCLTADNDKVFLLSPYASRPLGHHRNSVDETQEGWEAPDPARDRLLRSLKLTVVEEAEPVVVAEAPPEDEAASDSDSDAGSDVVEDDDVEEDFDE
jgi:hypothetical protein